MPFIRHPRGTWPLLGIAFAFVLSATAGPVDQRPAAVPATVNASILPARHDAGTGRLIVQLEAPALASYRGGVPGLAATDIRVTGDDRLAVTSSQSLAYRSHLAQARLDFVHELQQTLPGATVAVHINERGQAVASTFELLFNGLAVTVGGGDPQLAIKALEQIPGVRAVYPDRFHVPHLHASLDLIGAPQAWAQAGGRIDAGRGIKLASMDGGIHHDAPMFDGTGWTYPEGYPLGDTSNTNGKIIVSRAYFRPTQPPTPGDENPWPGTNGTSHGVHTASTAAGNIVAEALYSGTDVGSVSGVAPGAWVMSYRVFYPDADGRTGFYTAEGLAALEDIVRDGADVVNNSWGSGPGSIGAPFDPLDQALINAANAGVFVAMSNGNSGPNEGTGGHPSADYINVAATTSGGAYNAGRLHAVAPEPVADGLTDLTMAASSFGAPLPAGQQVRHPLRAAASVDAGNANGCSPWPANTFDGRAALIARGICEFGVKVRNAELAGATLVIVHNNAGDSLINMGPGAVGHEVAISSLFIGQTAGQAMLQWHVDHGDAAEIEVDMRGFSVGNVADVVASFSSRGPSAAGTLKPDIAAPGVNVIAQGYAVGAVGEDRHLGYGQVSGTSMAAPHVAGAAAVLRQLYPDWSNDAIKSALMSTSKYLDVYTHLGTPAQPLDMGAGRLDLQAALDPGVILDPPSLSFGYLTLGDSREITVTVTSVAATTETYTTSSVRTADGFDSLSAVPGLSISPAQIELAPGASATLTVRFDSTSDGVGVGDNQGFVELSGSNGHHAHLPAWARISQPAAATADVLLLQNDMSALLGFPNYLGYYTSTLDALGVSYDLFGDTPHWWADKVIPHPAVLASYRAVLYFSGDHFRPDGFFSVKTPLARQDMDRLVEYANQGGVVIVTGQDAYDVINGHYLSAAMGATRLVDGIAGGGLPDQPIVPLASVPSGFDGISLDLTAPKALVDHALTGAQAVPPVVSSATGTVGLRFLPATNTLAYTLSITAPDPLTVIAVHLRRGGPGVNGALELDLYPHEQFGFPLEVAGSVSWQDSRTLTSEQANLLATGQLYLSISSLAEPEGELRADLAVPVGQWSGDGAGNQYWVDQLAPYYLPLLQYPPVDGVVAVLRRDQPSLERPGISFRGRMAYLGFGLEGVSDGLDGATSRADLLGRLFDWANDEPAITLEASLGSIGPSGQTVQLDAGFVSNVAGTTAAHYRWDFGDGSAIGAPTLSDSASHEYRSCGVYTARAEVTDSWGNLAIGSVEVSVSEQCGALESIFANGFEGP
jgi:subtilisin family serine protease